MICNEYNSFSMLCQGCEYPLNIKCCKEVKFKCIKGFCLEKCDDNGFLTDIYLTVEQGSVWIVNNDKYRFCAGYSFIKH